MLKEDFEEMKKEGRNWEEDFEHENGDYICKCVHCDHAFRGHKRRVVCRKCAILNEGVEKTI